MIDLVQGPAPFVAFIGAAASAMPPSSLPTWKGFNNLLLECLCERLADYSGQRQPTSEILSRFRATRELDELATEVFPGYCPHYYLAHGECFLIFGDEAQKQRIPELIARAREMGELTQNPWAGPAADNLEQRVKKSEAG